MPNSLTARRMKDILGLAAQTVGVKFIAAGAGAPENAEILERHRYCQALMLARRGHKVFLNAEGLACPAAAAAFGFRELPEPLKTGKGLVGFGMSQTAGRSNMLPACRNWEG
jgi:uncharacterized protein (DUF169 family)